MESERLDALLAALWPAAMAGNCRAVDRCLSVMHRRAKLLGLDAPSRRAVEVITEEDVDRVIRHLQAKADELERAAIDGNGHGSAPPGPRRGSRRTLAANATLASFALVLAFSGCGNSGSADSRPAPPPPTRAVRLSRAAQETRMTGLWLATGRPVGENNGADGFPHEAIKGLWRIERRCAGRRCDLEFTRQTRYGAASTQLEWDYDHWVGYFEAQTACAGSGRTATAEAEWFFEVTPTSIVANESIEVPASAHCNSTEQEVEWIAKPAASVLARRV